MSVGPGQLCVDIRHDGRQITDLSVALERPVDAVSKLLVGRTPEEGLALVGVLFSLCGRAHQAAGSLAVARALGTEVPAEQWWRQQHLLVVERVRETALRLMRDWQLPGTDESSVRELLARTATLISLVESSGSDLAQSALTLKNWWLGLCRADDSWSAWCELRSQRWQGITLGPGLPDLEPERVKGAVADWVRGEPNDPVPLKNLRAGCGQTGPAASGELTEAKAVIGSCLERLLMQIEADLAWLVAPHLSLQPELEHGDTIWGEELGWAWVHTARGWLLHSVAMDRGRIARWMILAPTDVNFHTEGVLRKRLPGVKVERKKAKALVSDLVLALDPCVDYKVSIQYA
ncbi:MAG: hypothetical protein CMI01_00910 [Oceanospirillaceae bacterium]|nr:hypothetical protein [Oceanospirillaceae bacterium]